MPRSSYEGMPKRGGIHHSAVFLVCHYDEFSQANSMLSLKFKSPRASMVFSPPSRYWTFAPAHCLHSHVHLLKVFALDDEVHAYGFSRGSHPNGIEGP
jgi:hypothetical protein